MQRQISSIALFALCALAVGTADAQTLVERALGQSIDRVLDQPEFENAFWGMYVIDASSGAVIYERNAAKSFVPASNTKLYTTAAALEQLGPDFRYVTTVHTDGSVHNGTLRGNLIVRGSGDPSIGGRFTDGERLQTFSDWADSLAARGITAIDGDIIGDDDIFDDQALGYGWSWDDETYWYSAEISGLSYNDNNVDFSIRSRSRGAPAEISWEPLNTDYVTVVNRTVTISPDSSIDEGYRRARGTNVIEISSRVPQGATDEESLTITNPTLYFVHVLRESLLQSGISVNGLPRDIDDLPVKPAYDEEGMMRLATYTSPPLADIVEVINKRSQNLYAEQLLKTLGAHRIVADEDARPGSAEMGVAAAMGTLASASVDTSRIQLADGSGLSRHNLVTPEMTGRLLSYMSQHPDAGVQDAFYNSLPLGGVDGTLQYRFRTGRASANVRAKTGTLSNASALGGYLQTRRGQRIAFVMMVNHYTTQTRAVRLAQDEVVELLASW